MADVGALTLVLLGRTGNGKSATANSIVGKKVFKSRKSSSGVTRSAELHTCVRKDGQVINVIDTPGIFDLSSGADYTAREIVKCIDLASGGIHAVLLIFSVRTRFSQEEEATIRILQSIFGSKIVDYAIVVFTGGDELEDDDITLEDYLGSDCPVALKDILAICKNRCVLFDNKTRSGTKNAEQVGKLLAMVKEVVVQNGGQPYTHGLFSDLKLQEKLNEVKGKLEQQLVEEREARLKAEERMQQIHKETGDEIRNLNESLRLALQRPINVKVESSPPPSTCRIL